MQPALLHCVWASYCFWQHCRAVQLGAGPRCRRRRSVHKILLRVQPAAGPAAPAAAVENKALVVAAPRPAHCSLPGARGPRRAAPDRPWPGWSWNSSPRHHFPLLPSRGLHRHVARGGSWRWVESQSFRPVPLAPMERMRESRSRAHPNSSDVKLTAEPPPPPTNQPTNQPTNSQLTCCGSILLHCTTPRIMPTDETPGPLSRRTGLRPRGG